MDTSVLIAIAGAGVAVAAGSYMTLVEQFNIQVRELELSFPNLPPAFDGYTLLHLSDLHLTKLGLLEKRTMEIIGSRPVDGCVITGDVTAEPRASDIFRRVCSAIKHTDPILMVLGNSEHKPWLDSDMLVNALSFDGLKMLINTSTFIERNGERIVVVGVDDPYSHRDKLNEAFRNVNADDFIIFLTHCPSLTPLAISHNADLILAGHTHGGQVRLPGLGMLWTHMNSNKRLSDGLYTSTDLKRILRTDIDHSILFVNRGVGTSRLHIRFFCPPEIVYITLRRRSVQ